MTILNPAGAGNSWALGGFGTQQVGQAVIGPDYHAGLWSGTAASWVDLNPAGATGSAADGISGAQQVGASDGHAGLWSGTAASFVDLNPVGATGSNANGISGTRQAGSAVFTGASHAGEWSGTAASWVDLNPTGAPGSVGYGISGGQVAGSVSISVPVQVLPGVIVNQTSVHAAVWNGGADSWVDLNPLPHPGPGYDSVARATDGTHQVGWTILGEFAANHAAFWSGTAASWVDLQPAGATNSAALGVFGTLQVGNAVFGHFEDGGDTFVGTGHASLWSGTAASWEDLSLGLPGSWQNTEADSIWSDGATLFIAGNGYSLTDGRAEAILWSRPVPEPDGLVLAGLGLLGLACAAASLRRSRQSLAKGDG